LSGSKLLLQQVQNGAMTTLSHKNIQFELGRTYQVRADLSGATIAVSIDGTSVGSFTTTFNQTATRHGILCSNTGPRKWERFTVSQL